MMTSRLLCWLLIGCAGAPCADALTIDQMLAQYHREENVTPTNGCDDATFFRRLSLDLMGRVPTTDELSSFLKQPDRAAAIDRLLDSEEHQDFWSGLWTTMLIGRNQQRGVDRQVLHSWLREQLKVNRSVNQIAFELISAEGVTALDGPVNYVVASRADPVMRLSRTFLSVQLDCARCHDHPFDRWTNDDYMAMQRFYRPVRYREVSGGIAVNDAAGDDATKPVFLTGRATQTRAWRRELALMVVQSKPFSRAMVNRTWSWLMGRGIVDPVDGLSRDNRGSVPDLLESLAADFRSGFQLKELVRQICNSDAYQRQPAAGVSSESQRQRELFAARTTRPMMPEQWVASLAVALDRPLPDNVQLYRQVRQLLGVSPQATPDTDPFQWTETSQTLVRQLSGPVRAPLRNVDSLFLATVARPPTTAEREMVKDHTSQELLFALIHSNEFIMND